MSPSPRRYRWIYISLANSIAGLHIVWSLFILGGAVAMIFIPSYAFIEILALTITILVNIPLLFSCPLTVLEGMLRKRISPEYTNHNSFMATYLNKLFGTHLTTRSANRILYVAYTIIYTYAFLSLLYR